MVPRVLLHSRINQEPSPDVLAEAEYATSHLWPGAVVVTAGDAWFSDFSRHLGEFDRWAWWCGYGTVYGGAPSFVGALTASDQVGSATGDVISAMHASGRPTYILGPGGPRRVVGGQRCVEFRGDWTLTGERAT